jgi:3-oxo-5alpha-steroid 4-dehydrogenase
MNQDCDVVIVGSGVAGLCAAIEAAQQGLSVIILDRFAGGGASTLSGGVVYAGGGTKIQQQANEKDTVDNMFNYLKQEVVDAVSDDTLRDFCQQSSANLDWLMEQGVPFDATTYDEKTSYPPEGYFLYYSGNEICSPYIESASPARRGHRTKGPSFTGKVLYQKLRKRVASIDNIKQINFSNVTALTTNQDGKISGVSYQQLGNGSGDFLSRISVKLANKLTMLKPSLSTKIRGKISSKLNRQAQQSIAAKQGVILASGGFVFNREMVKQHAPIYRHCQALGENCDGAGINLAVNAGGATKFMERFSAWRFISPPTAMCKGLLVAKNGQRIVNEDLYGAKTAEHMVNKNQGKGLLIVDSKLLKEIKLQARPIKIAWHQWLPNRILLATSTKKSNTIEGLAKACKLPVDTLQQTLKTYNDNAIANKDAFAKADKYLQPLLQAPFYAIDISINNPNVPCPALSLGGLVVNEQTSMVLNEQGQSIKGLYAVGRAAVGICSHSYVSGLSLADCVYSGRRAAQAIKAG